MDSSGSGSVTRAEVIRPERHPMDPSFRDHVFCSYAIPAIFDVLANYGQPKNLSKRRSSIANMVHSLPCDSTCMFAHSRIDDYL